MRLLKCEDDMYFVGEYVVDRLGPDRWRCGCQTDNCQHLNLLLTYLAGGDLPLHQPVATPDDAVLYVRRGQRVWVPRHIDKLARRYFSDLDADGRQDSDDNRNSWLWFTCPAPLRSEVAAQIAQIA